MAHEQELEAQKKIKKGNEFTLLVFIAMLGVFLGLQLGNVFFNC